MSSVAAVGVWCLWLPLGLLLRCEGHRMLGSEASNGGQAKRQQCADLSSDEYVCQVFRAIPFQDADLVYEHLTLLSQTCRGGDGDFPKSIPQEASCS